MYGRHTVMSADVNQESQLPTPAWPVWDDAVAQAMQQMIQDGSWGRYHGPHCEALRAALSRLTECEHIALCSSGTSAVELCLRGVGVEPGDEVILAAYDYKANFVNVLNLGAVPVLVDTVANQPIPDPLNVEAAVGARTKAVVVSHLHGCHAPMQQIMRSMTHHRITVIEDACQSPGALVAGRPAGSWGDVSALSFGGSKLLTAGRGGAVVTNNARIAQKIRLYTHRGNDAYPLSEMQAAVLLPQLLQLTDNNARRQASVDRIAERLATSGQAQIIAAAVSDECQPVFYKLAIQVGYVTDRAQTVAISNHARRLGVALDPAFTALHLTHSAARYRAPDRLDNAQRLHHQLLTLHHPVLLSTSEVIDQVSRILLDVLADRKV
jgi:dTDP-4-amino-4,6-dideoxygalactose transaminase